MFEILFKSQTISDCIWVILHCDYQIYKVISCVENREECIFMHTATHFKIHANVIYSFLYEVSLQSQCNQLSQDSMTYNFHSQLNSHLQQTNFLGRPFSDQNEMQQEQNTSSQQQCDLLYDYRDQESSLGNQSSSENSMDQQTSDNVIVYREMQKQHKAQMEQNSQFQVNFTYRSVYSGKIYQLPQNSLSNFIWRNNISDLSDGRIRQNMLFYQMLMRMKELEIAYVDSNMQLKHDNGIALGYYNNTRGLFSYTQRKAGDRLIRIPRKQLIDVSWSQDSDMLFHIKTQKKLSQVSEIVKRIIYLFQSAFIKRQYKHQFCKYFRQKLSDSFERCSQQNGNNSEQQYSTFYENSFVQDVMPTEIFTLYLELLPKNYDDLPSMDDYFSQCFKNDQELMDKKKLKKLNIKELFLTIDNLISKETLFKYWRNTYRAEDSHRFHKNFIKYFKAESIAWCYNVIATRSFSVVLQHPTNFDLTFLAPAIDLINHSNTPNCEWGYDSETQSFYVQTIEYIGAGEEFTIRYGNLSNLNLLMNYGICIPQNQQESTITVYPDFQSRLFTKSLELRQISLNQLVACFPWLEKEKKRSQFRDYKRRRSSCFSLSLCSNKIEDNVEKIMRKVIQELRNHLTQKSSITIFTNQYIPIRVNDKHRAFVVYRLLMYFKTEVQRIMQVKSITLNRLKFNDPLLYKRVNYITLLDEQIQTCSRIISFIMKLKKDEMYDLAQLLKLQRHQYYNQAYRMN